MHTCCVFIQTAVPILQNLAPDKLSLLKIMIKNPPETIKSTL